ncbi:hypothetical protein LPUS_01259 [Lasallia pustulata]|uniref:Uncharacterized protein n=1 Tax=Lasallia pustulata TaxID=136370 RepID=A0A1W5D9Q0_9LECA|nr:hypothetical protein LPUS_01259 [Lasallia pustulata]
MSLVRWVRSDSQWRPSALFWLPGNSKLYDDNSGTGGHGPPNVVEELGATYALLFGYPKDQAAKLFGSPGSELGILMDLVYSRSDPTSGRERSKPQLLHPGGKRVDRIRGFTRKLLSGYLRLPAPLRITYFYPKANLNPYERSCKRYYQKRLTDFGQSMTIEELIQPGSPYPIDVLMHMKAILNNPLEETEAFSQYPMFGDHLRQLKALMDQRKPRTWKQLWTDRRDAVNYYTIWSVVIFGTITTLLALVSLAVPTAQAMASFRQL